MRLSSCFSFADKRESGVFCALLRKNDDVAAGPLMIDCANKFDGPQRNVELLREPPAGVCVSRPTICSGRSQADCAMRPLADARWLLVLLRPLPDPVRDASLPWPMMSRLDARPVAVFAG